VTGTEPDPWRATECHGPWRNRRVPRVGGGGIERIVRRVPEARSSIRA